MSLVVRPIQFEEMKSVKDAGVLDDHAIIAPTHVIQKDDTLYGCLSVNAIPLVLPWLNTKLCHKFDSARVMRTVEDSLRMAGQRYMAIPLHSKSPFYGLVERDGYAKFIECSLYMKVL